MNGKMRLKNMFYEVKEKNALPTLNCNITLLNANAKNFAKIILLLC